MFTRSWRRHVLRPALALALIAGFLATPVAISHAGLVAHDSCDTQESGPDPALPRLASSDGPHAHGHCFTCHWFRSLRTALVSAGVNVPEADPAGLLLGEALIVVAAAPGPIAGARAPPA
jgi:hypothetical protein